MEIKKNVAIAVLSSDGYADVWPHFFSMFFRNWPDCPFPVYLITGTNAYKHDRVVTVHSSLSPQSDWSSRMIDAIKKICSTHVILFLEDFFLTKRVKTRGVVDFAEWCIDADADYLRLRPFPGPDERFNEKIGRISAKVLYRVCLQTAIWKRSVLLDLLKPGETPWDFEIHGSERSAKYHHFYSITNKAWKAAEGPIVYIQGIEKGVWNRPAVKLLTGANCPVDTKIRRVMSSLDILKWNMLRIKGELLNMFPQHQRPRVLESVRRFYRMIGLQ